MIEKIKQKFLELIKNKKIVAGVALGLVCILVLSIALCSGKKPGKDDNKVDLPTDPFAGKTHAQISESLYNSVLGEFNDLYEDAKAADTIAERFALMAIAEAKMLSTGVMLPSTAQGGNYAISRVAPYTSSPVLWGNDSDRFYKSIIVNEDPLLPAERDELKAKWAELRGTGEYRAWAKEYLKGKNYTLADEYTFGYTADPTTWDILNTSEAVDAEAIVNTFDGLLEYDNENVQQPALAESYTISEDGLTYTFKIREGVKWVNYQGVYVENLTAHSFVAGFQHMLDAQGGLEYLVQGVVKNAYEYCVGEVTDFDKVGIKAVDDYTLVYTLEQPTSYFTTMFGYNVFAPMSKVMFEANGGVFGVDAFADAQAGETYTYGTTAETIGYCGPYLVASVTASNSIVFEANDSYWNAEEVELNKITWRFIDGQDPTETYDLMKAGTFAGAGLNTNAVAKAKADGLFDRYAYVSGTDATSYPVFLNLYRSQYGNYNDATVAPTTLTEADKIRTNLALQNENFRLAFVTALDRGAYNATLVGDDLKLASLVNSYTPGDFVSLPEEVTVKINGTDKTYAAGTFYGAIMQDQLDADGIKIKVWDKDANAGAGASYGFDGWYNPEFSQEKLTAAIEELKAQNVEISKDKPIILELPYYDVYTPYANRANALKQSIEATTNGLIKVQLVKCGGSDPYNWYDATYFPQSGNDMNYNISDNSGWGPDYGDPATYLDTMYLGGYMLKCLGIY